MQENAPRKGDYKLLAGEYMGTERRVLPERVGGEKRRNSTRPTSSVPDRSEIVAFRPTLLSSGIPEEAERGYVRYFGPPRDASNLGQGEFANDATPHCRRTSRPNFGIRRFGRLCLSRSTDFGRHRKIVNRVTPIYPELAKRMQIAGTVKVEAIVAPNGKVKSTKVIGGSPVLTKAALDAIEAWKWAATSSESKELIELSFHPQ